MTHKNALADIEDVTNCAVTTKGLFYPQGRYVNGTGVLAVSSKKTYAITISTNFLLALLLCNRFVLVRRCLLTETQRQENESCSFSLKAQTRDRSAMRTLKLRDDLMRRRCQDLMTSHSMANTLSCKSKLDLKYFSGEVAPNALSRHQFWKKPLPCLSLSLYRKQRKTSLNEIAPTMRCSSSTQ